MQGLAPRCAHVRVQGIDRSLVATASLDGPEGVSDLLDALLADLVPADLVAA